MNDTASIMSIRELIDSAFGDANMNVVNHKLIQTILIILARQLRLLERRVEIEIGPIIPESSGTSISVTEVKLHANVPRKKKGKLGATSTSTTKGLKPSERRAEKPFSGKDTTKSSAAFVSKSITERSTSDKSSTEKSSSAMTSSGTKSTTEPSSSLKTSTGISSSDKTKSSTDTKLSTDQTKSTTTTSEKTTTEKTSSDQTSTDKTSSDKTSTDKTSSDKTTTDEKSSTTDKSSTEKSSSDKPSTEKSSSDKPSTEKSSSDKPSTEKSSSDKPSTEKSSGDKTSTGKSTSEPTTDKSSSSAKRADSREERDKTPTPITSLESMERQYEKLLIVERVPTGQVAESRSQTEGRDKTPRLSVVTQEEFEKLTELVRQLQNKFGSAVGKAVFPENAQLMDDLRKGASLTDAMAALQLAARVEAAEKALEKMLTLITELARKTPGIDVEEIMERARGMDQTKTEVIFGGPSTTSQVSGIPKKKSIVPPKETIPKSKKVVAKAASKESLILPTLSRLPSETLATHTTQEDQPTEAGKPAETKSQEPKDWISYEELDGALQEIYDEFLKMLNTSTSHSNTNANNALKIAHLLEGKFDDALDLGDRMFDLEKLVAEYAEQINTMDTGLSSQMTNYQEQLTQMQHDLESGLEAMAEALANTGGDTAAVAELNNRFTCLQNDIDISSMRQKELRDIQDALSMDLQSLWKQIEILRDTKSDRDEVADALKDKAGLDALNGLVSRQEFDAVRGDFEKRIGSAYDKFNNQEIVWQKAIDDLLRELGEKADWIQLVSLQGSINQYLDKLRDKIQAMSDVVGEPRAASVSRKLHREAECLCCATPAHMDMEQPICPPSLPTFGSSRPPAIGAESRTKPSEDGDHGICYPGLPVPHAVDPRAHVCHRYCGGSHTIIDNTVSRAPVGMIIKPALRKVNTAMGSDGKLYMVDDDTVKRPCLPCNFKKTVNTPEPSEAEPAPVQEDYVSGMTPSDFRMPSMEAADDCAPATPPPPIDDDQF